MCKHLATKIGTGPWHCSKCGEPGEGKPSIRVSEADRRAIREFAAGWWMSRMFRW